MTTRVKICGLSTPETVDAAVAAGADYLGFTFVSKSPRLVAFDKAGSLAARVPPSVLKVALSVDADDAAFDAMVKAIQPDILQLHGTETPERLVGLQGPSSA